MDRKSRFEADGALAAATDIACSVGLLHWAIGLSHEQLPAAFAQFVIRLNRLQILPVLVSERARSATDGMKSCGAPQPVPYQFQDALLHRELYPRVARVVPVVAASRSDPRQRLRGEDGTRTTVPYAAWYGVSH